MNALHNRLEIAQDQVVPEPQDGIPLTCHPCIAAAIPPRAIGVLSAVHFHDEAKRAAREIRDVGSHRMLATEPNSELVVPQPTP